MNIPSSPVMNVYGVLQGPLPTEVKASITTEYVVNGESSSAVI